MIGSFGDEVSHASSSDAAAMVRHLARASEEQVWAAHFLTYRIDSWTVAGTWTGALIRDVDWFPAANAPPSEAAQIAPRQATISGIWDDGAGYLWVFITVADQAWAPLPLKPAPVPGMFEEEPVLDPFLDTIIEVIDLERSAVIARMRDDRALTSVLGGYLVSYEEDHTGLPSYRILRPRVRGSRLSVLGGAR